MTVGVQLPVNILMYKLQKITFILITTQDIQMDGWIENREMMDG